MGRPRLPETRKRRDYRFSPATLRLIEQGRKISGQTETAFVEAAIARYLDFLAEKEVEASDLERQPLAFPGVTREQVAALAEASPVSSSQKPVYQIYVKHEPGACPDLPEGFDYIDRDRSAKRRCEYSLHRVFAQPVGIEAARRRVKQLQAVAGVVRVWIEDRKGQPLPRDCWRRENGRWLRDD
jgi:hypothetical protein